MIVGQQRWVGDEDESAQPTVRFGFVQGEPCSACGRLVPCALLWAETGPGQVILEIALCRSCLDAGISATYANGEHRPVVPAPRAAPVRRGRPRRALSPRLRFRVLKRDGYRCRMCGATAESGARLHIDHRVPVARGGSSNEDNLQVLCESCNLGKGVQEP